MKRLLALSVLTAVSLLAELPPPTCQGPQCADKSLMAWIKQIFQPTPKKPITVPAKRM